MAANYALGEAILSTRIDLSGISQGIGQAESTLRSGLQTASSGALGFFQSVFAVGIGGIVTNAISGVTSAISGLGQSMIAGNAQFEGYETQFATLMGSTDAAKAHIADLATFAAKTPFELPEVITASKSLLTFGGALLDTKENMNIVGNAAAATGQHINEVAFWYGRAYSAIQGGRPFGESAARLQEMGILTATARNKLEDLQKTGASSTEVWSEFQKGLVAPTDAMDKLGKTWTGLTSTISDTMGALTRTMGQPIFDLLKPQLQGLIDLMGRPDILNAAQAIGQALADLAAGPLDFLIHTALPIAINAFTTFGAGLSSGGIIGGIAALFDSLSSIHPLFGVIGDAVVAVGGILSNLGALFLQLAGEATGWGEALCHRSPMA